MKKKSTKKPKTGKELKVLLIQMAPELHGNLKALAAFKNVSIKHYVTEALIAKMRLDEGRMT